MLSVVPAGLKFFCRCARSRKWHICFPNKKKSLVSVRTLPVQRVHAHLIIHLGRNDSSLLKPPHQVQLGPDLLGAPYYPHTEQGTGQVAPVAGHADALLVQVLAVNQRQQSTQGRVHTGRVHVSALSGNKGRRLDPLGEILLAEKHELFSDSLVRQAGHRGQRAELGGMSLKNVLSGSIRKSL
jgi:hypothetical protein